MRLSRTFVAFTLLVLSLGVHAKDFRNVNWGDDYKTVYESEEDAKGDGVTNISVKTTVDDIPVALGYTFAQNKLFKAMYLCKECKSLIGKLEKQYGKPTEQNDTKTSLSWVTDKTIVTASRTNNSVFAIFVSTEFAHLQKADKQPAKQ